MIQRQAAVELVHGYQAAGEVAVGNGVGGALLRYHRQAVHRFAVNALEGGDGIGTDALVGLRVLFAQAQVVTVDKGRLAGILAEGGHHFAATANHQVLHAGHDGRGGHVH